MTLWSLASDILYPPSERAAEWGRAHPVEWCHTILGISLWSKQRDVITSVRDNSQTAVYSCHNVGKSLVAACTVLWWVSTHPPGTAFAVTSAPTYPQVRAVLWREIARLHAGAAGQVPGRTTQLEWTIDNSLVALGRKPSDYEPTAFQGIHAEHCLVVLDEACGFAPALWDAASSLTSNDGSRILAIGNPDSSDTRFAENCARPSWHPIQISAVESPAWTGEQVSDAARVSLITRSWAAERAAEWGPESSLYGSKILATFPTAGDGADVVMRRSALDACREDLTAGGDVAHTAGLDVGAGGDRTVLYERRGPTPGREMIFTDADPMASVGRLADVLRDWARDGLTDVHVDCGGVGWALTGRLREVLRGVVRVTGVNFGSAARDPARYANVRAELWWGGRDRCRDQTWDLSDVDPDVLGELASARYRILDSGGRIQIERKDEIRKRLGRSPDRADALLLAFYRGAPMSAAPRLRSVSGRSL